MAQKTNKIKVEQYERTISLRFEGVKENTRTVPAAISSEAVVNRWFGSEKLIHSDKAINMERAADGIPLLYNHDMNQPIGRAENIRLEDGVLRGDLSFSNNPLAQQVFQDVDERFLRDVSLGYRIERYKDVKGGIEATRWMPHEVSIVSVPADSSVGVNRKLDDQEVSMSENEKDGKTIIEKVGADHTLGVNEGMRLEQERAKKILITAPITKGIRLSIIHNIPPANGRNTAVIWLIVKLTAIEGAISSVSPVF